MTVTDETSLAGALTDALNDAQAQEIAPPSADELHRLSLRVAVLSLLADDARARYAAARQDAEPVFAAARACGTRQQAIVLPGGVEAGLLAIKQGAQVTDVDENELLMLVAIGQPDELEDYAVPTAASDQDALAFLIEQVPDLFTLRASALQDERLVKLLAEHFPHLVGRRIRPAHRVWLQEYLESHDGQVPDPATGEAVKVATIRNLPPTGEFAYTGKTKYTGRLRDALATGALKVTETGDVIAAGPAAPPDGGE